MKKIAHKIIINKPIAEVFAACLNPENTPNWIEGIVKEQASDHPAKLGTTYKNHGSDGVWLFYTVVAFDHNKSFTLSDNDSSYNVKYVFNPLKNSQTEFEYSEWMDEGELESPLHKNAIRKLKQLIES